tara:strand:- start:1417 stop:1650 length:234 start_codon:yes stop_codon:yes gene_type:complete
MFVNNQTVKEIAIAIQPAFEVGALYSRSSIREVAQHAREELADRRLPTRKSLCFVVAKLALALWQETIEKTNQSIGE